MIEVLKNINRKISHNIEQNYAQQGGWASLAYKIEDNNGHYTFKSYEKAENQHHI